MPALASALCASAIASGCPAPQSSLAPVAKSRSRKSITARRLFGSFVDAAWAVSARVAPSRAASRYQGVESSGRLAGGPPSSLPEPVRRDAMSVAAVAAGSKGTPVGAVGVKNELLAPAEQSVWSAGVNLNATLVFASP